MEINFENVDINFPEMQWSEPFNLKVSKTNEKDVYFVFNGKSINFSEQTFLFLSNLKFYR